jgi:ribosome recycling factor
MENSEIIENSKASMEKSITALKSELQKVRTGRASATLLDGIKVSAYGSQMSLNSVASISTPEPRLIVVNPYDKGQISSIEKAILTSGLGLTPTNDSKVIRLPVPALSEERRKEIVKKVKKICEDAKIAMRQHRQDANNKIKSLQKDKALSEDQAKKLSEDIQKLTNKFTQSVDEVYSLKEKEILTV